jgi:hypothetical protein
MAKVHLALSPAECGRRSHPTARGAVASVVVPAVLDRQVALGVPPAVEVDRALGGSPGRVDAPVFSGPTPAGSAAWPIWSSVDRHRVIPVVHTQAVWPPNRPCSCDRPPLGVSLLTRIPETA